MAIVQFNGPAGAPALTPRHTVQAGPALYFVAFSDMLTEPNFQYQFYVRWNGSDLAEYLVPPNEAGRGFLNLASVVRNLTTVEHAALNFVQEEYGEAIHRMPRASLVYAQKGRNAIGLIEVGVREHYGQSAAPIGSYVFIGHYIQGTTRPVYHLPTIGDTTSGYSPILEDLYQLHTASPLRRGWMVEGGPVIDTGIAHLDIYVAQDSEGVLSRLHDRATTAAPLQASDRTEYRIEAADGTVTTVTIIDNAVLGHPNALSTDTNTKLVYEGWYPANVNDPNHPLPPATKPQSVSGWRSYTVRRMRLGQAASWRMRFLPSKQDPCKHDPTILAFTNLYGGWQYIYCTGRRAKIAEVERRTTAQPLSPMNEKAGNWEVYDRQERVFATTKRQKYIVDTGPMSVEESRLLESMYQSRDLMARIFGVWYPAILEGSRARIADEPIANTKAATVEFRLSATDRR